MKNMKLVTLVIVLLIVSISCTLFTPTSSTEGVVAGDINQVFDELPVYDPEAPLPSPGATALRLLMELDPNVSVLESDVEASEREALNALLADLQIKLDEGDEIKIPYLPSQPGSVKVAIFVAEDSLPVSSHKIGAVDGTGNFSFEAMFIGILTSMALDELSVHAESDEGKYASEKEGGATTDTGIKFKKNPDGTTSLEVVTKTDASKKGVSANTDSKVSVDGQRCPNAAGQVSFTIKEHFNAESGGASYTVDLSADVRVEVNDDAEMVNVTIDTTQGTRKVKDGKNVYVESGVTNKNGTTSNQRLIRSSQEATSGDVSNLSAAGEAAAYNMALGSLLFARDNWLKGGCTKIEATSPGTVERGSTTAIPVKVRHRIEGIEVPSKLKAVLSGGQSIDPTTLPKTPGTLNYTAPDEYKKTATITLTAMSKRGKATLELTANTGEPSYKVNDAGLSGRSWVTQCIPSLDKPYQISWKSPQGSGEFSFSPNSGNWESGSVNFTETNSQGGVTVTIEGEGTYVITVLSKDSKGNPEELSIDYETKGTFTQCVKGGGCTTKENVSISASVPIKISDKSCE